MLDNGIETQQLIGRKIIRKQLDRMKQSLKYLYTIGLRMENKCVLNSLTWEGKFDLIGIFKTWWDMTHDWNVITEDYNIKNKYTEQEEKRKNVICKIRVHL